MLMSQERGKADQSKPAKNCSSDWPVQMPRVGIDQENEERGMERREKIKGAIQPAIVYLCALCG